MHNLTSVCPIIIGNNYMDCLNEQKIKCFLEDGITILLDYPFEQFENSNLEKHLENDC